MTELLEELEEKREKANARAEKFKILRDRKNLEAKRLVQKRDELNTKVRDLIDRGNELKDIRNELNEGVHEAKRVRDKMNKKVTDLTQKLRNKKKELLPKDGPSLDMLERDIRRLEFNQMTQVLSPDKERELVDKISSLKGEIEGRKSIIEGDEDVQRLTAELEEAKRIAEENHLKVSENARSAQERHDEMLKLFKEADQIRLDADETHERFINAKVKSDEYHNSHIEAVHEVQDYSKMIYGYRKKTRMAIKRKDEEDTLSKAQELYEQFKKGEKLGTEDIMMLQKAGFL